MVNSNTEIIMDWNWQSWSIDLK